ncbi:MAG: hypothetical protein C4B59_03065 [Candidatus Methanogaster sp.]|uniref:Uncharacterized protein n=1 Tax=Candidatus Methanogaster sp. TaxID=3386292 RepID=A0AC61L4U9_9EURY|nr:MAG: hypothetical protein C4B59_03065 [ANME-2 cluster archaeon]
MSLTNYAFEFIPIFIDVFEYLLNTKRFTRARWTEDRKAQGLFGFGIGKKLDDKLPDCTVAFYLGTIDGSQFAKHTHRHTFQTFVASDDDLLCHALPCITGLLIKDPPEVGVRILQILGTLDGAGSIGMVGAALQEYLLGRVFDSSVSLNVSGFKKRTRIAEPLLDSSLYAMYAVFCQMPNNRCSEDRGESHHMPVNPGQRTRPQARMDRK